MSRSRKRTPRHNICVCHDGTMKDFHRIYHQRERMVVRGLLAHGDYDEAARYEVPYHQEWGMPNDGQHYWPKPRDTERLQVWHELMRK